MKNFLDVFWTDLLVVTYEVEASALEKYLPVGTELDSYEGRHYVSVVAFEFSKTRICGIPMPFYRSFPEVNLRFYVRRKEAGEWRRGVVFIKEIVPCKIPALLARKIFRENFHVHSLRCKLTDDRITYCWDHRGEEQEITTPLEREFELPESGSLHEHLIERYWAYKGLSNGKTAEFQVSHRAWEIQNCPRATIKLDIPRIYGTELGDAIHTEPVSVFYAKGSRVWVSKPSPC